MIKFAQSRKLKVGVFMGGKSLEREVSFNSGRTICDHIDHFKYEVIPIFQRVDGNLFILPWHFLHRGKILDFVDRLETESKKISWDELKKMVDFVYIAVHGRFAEDGTIQGFLEVLGIPYLGSGIFGSSLGIDKIMQKHFLRSNNIEVARHVVFSPAEIKKLSNETILKKLDLKGFNLPCVVKPNSEGSSFGVSVVEDGDYFLDAIEKASTCYDRFRQPVLVEEKLDGMEFVCVCLQKDNDVPLPSSYNIPSGPSPRWFALPITEVIPEKEIGFFDYDQKYMPGRATKITPANCSKNDQKRIQEICIKATEVLSFSTISRIDGFLTRDGRVVLIDPNTLTGMGPSTFLFHQAAEIGMNHGQLINYLIDIELKNYKKFGWYTNG